MPSLSLSLRASIHGNLNDIIALHEELLGDLHRVVPHSEYTQLSPTSLAKALGSKVAGHQRWRSLDAQTEKEDHGWIRRIPGMVAESKVAADVAKIFAQKVRAQGRRKGASPNILNADEPFFSL